MPHCTIIKAFIDTEVMRKYSLLSSKQRDVISGICLKFFLGNLSYKSAASTFTAMNCKTDLLNKLSNIKNVSEQPLPTTLTEDDRFPATKKRSNHWSDVEDDRLIAAVNKYGPKNWRLISDFVGGGRTSSQCNQRWCRALDPGINKGSWTREEDAKLCRAVEILGRASWCQVAKVIPGRTDLQCRYRFNHLNKLTPVNLATQQTTSSMIINRSTPRHTLPVPDPDEIKVMRRESISIAAFAMPNEEVKKKPIPSIFSFSEQVTMSPAVSHYSFMSNE